MAEACIPTSRLSSHVCHKPNTEIYRHGIAHDATMTSKHALITGELGCSIELPLGIRILSGHEDANDRLDILDQNNNLSWTIRFFDNLHMDLRSSMRFHLEKSIEAYVNS